MKMKLEQRRQAMLQLHLSDQQFYCRLRRILYQSFYGLWMDQLNKNKSEGENNAYFYEGEIWGIFWVWGGGY